MKFYLQILWCLMLLGTLNAQVEVQYFDNPDRLFHLNKIDGIPYFGKNTNQLDFNISPNNSQIYIFNGINFELKLNLNYINDSLNNAYLFVSDRLTTYCGVKEADITFVRKVKR